LVHIPRIRPVPVKEHPDRRPSGIARDSVLGVEEWVVETAHPHTEDDADSPGFVEMLAIEAAFGSKCLLLSDPIPATK